MLTRNSLPRQNRQYQLRQIFIRIYPYIHAGYEGMSLIFQFRFLFFFSPFFSPCLWLAGQQVKRLSLEDMKSQQQRQEAQSERRQTLEKAWEEGSSIGLLARTQRLLRRLGNLASHYTKFALLIAICFFKFIEWWHSPNNQVGQAANVPVPPPPPQSERATSGLTLPTNSSLCALCKNTRTNPATSPSGFVFCYPCIWTYISQHHRCPVTLQVCSTDQIRKLMSEAD
jgi:peroxin-12